MNVIKPRCTREIFRLSICSSKSSFSMLRQPPKVDKINSTGWLLLTIPVSTFSLGVWQIKRKFWKEELIADLQERSKSQPVPLPTNIDEINQLEYKPVHVRGQFLHDKELYMGPRSLLVQGDAASQSSLVSGNQIGSGYLVVTPFRLEDRDETILVNRGWVPSKHKDPKTRQKGQIEGPVDLIGIVRTHENRPNFALKNQEGSNCYFYRDLATMAAKAGTAPIYLDASIDNNVPLGPIGGQTRISLRNEHLSYILTWFGLSGATSFLWCKKFLK